MRWAILLAAACAGPPSADEAEPLETLEVAQRLASEGAARWPADRQVFNWINAVWGYGLLSVHAADGDPVWVDYGAAWMSDALPRFGGEDPFTIGASDELAAAGVASAVQALRPDLDLSPILDEAEAYLARAPRLAQGAIAHWGEPGLFQTDQAWIDSLFMIGMFHLQEFDRGGDRAHLEAVADQVDRFAALCRDETSGLWWHAYDDSEGVTIPTGAVFWARGNAWVLVVVSELLRRVDPADPLWDRLQPGFLDHATAVAALQAGDGLWYTVLNDPSPGDGRNYTETSAGALIARALAVGAGAGALDGLDVDPVLVRAVDGVLGRLREEDGALVLEGTSFGTNPGDYDNYVDTILLPQSALGVGAVLMALAELDGFRPRAR